MKNIIFVALMLFGGACGSVVAQISSTPKKEDSEQQLVERITLGVSTGWAINARKEGWSYLQYGAGSSDGFTIPKDKMSVIDIYNRISPHLHEPNDDVNQKISHVYLYFGGDDNRKHKIIDRDIAFELIEDVVKIVTPHDPARLKLILGSNPVRPQAEVETPSKPDGEVKASPVLGSGVATDSPRASPEKPQTIQQSPPQQIAPSKPPVLLPQPEAASTAWIWWVGGLALAALAFIVNRLRKRCG